MIAPGVPTSAELEAIRREAMEFAGIGLYRYTFDGRVLFMDEGAMKILGLEKRFSSPAEVTGRLISDLLVYVGPRGQLRALIREQRRVRGLEYAFETLDGEERWAQHDSYLVTDEATGEEQIQVVIKDITERKRAEIALGAERERLAVTLRSIGDGVITTDAAGRITLLNKVAEQLTGWSHEDALGRPLPEVFRIIDERHRTPRENPVERVLATGQVVSLANHTALIARDGRERVIADSGAPICDARSRILGVVLVFRDVTEKEKMERDLQRVEKLESVGVLAGGIAHDFNNLLAAILGSVSLARLYADGASRSGVLLEQAETAILRAKDLTFQLLTFARGGAPVKKTTSVAGIIRESATFAVSGSNVLLDFDLPQDLHLAEVDPGQLSQVIHNLTINAVQAMPDGGRVSISARNHLLSAGSVLPLPPGPYLLIAVADTGPGIPLHLQQRVFDPYYTTKKKGSGLGLSIVHSIVTKHDGHISVESRPGAGTRFLIHLPASLQAAAPEEPPVGSLIGGTGRLLVMDDDEGVLEASEQLLAHLGFSVTAVRSGAEAIEAYRQAVAADEPFEAVILDLTVPGGMGGAETVRRLARLDPNVRALASSGYSSDPIMANFRSFGFVGALPKPYTLAELSRALCTLGPVPARSPGGDEK